MNPNGYELSIWRGIYHNAQFSHNLIRKEIVHAWTEQQAMAILQLADEEITKVNDSLVIRAGREYLHSIQYLGRVTYKYVVEYVGEEDATDKISDS